MVNIPTFWSAIKRIDNNVVLKILVRLKLFILSYISLKIMKNPMGAISVLESRRQITYKIKTPLVSTLQTPGWEASSFPDIQISICFILWSDLVTLCVAESIALYCIQNQIITLH